MGQESSAVSIMNPSLVELDGEDVAPRRDNVDNPVRNSIVLVEIVALGQSAEIQKMRLAIHY